jgi:hypothetical protein
MSVSQYMRASRCIPNGNVFASEEERRYNPGVSGPHVFVLSPAGAVWEQRWLLVAHDRGETALSAAARWRPLVDEGWTLVAVQSSQVSDSAGFCWDDAGRGQVEILARLEECRRIRALDPAGAVIAGVGQGAGPAQAAALEAGLPWLCVVASVTADLLEGISGPALPGAPGAFLTGAPVTAERLSLCAARNVLVQQLPGFAGDLPDGFASAAADILRRFVDGSPLNPGSYG